MHILHLYVSPEHNFFGHHGQPPGDSPSLEVPAITCVPGHGIEGDRFFDYKTNYKGQITFFSQEIYERLCRDLAVHDKTPAALRRNVVVSGVDLNTLTNTEFEVQGIHFQGCEECRPCYWMDQSFGPGAELALKGHGGLRARILTGGTLRVDAPAL